VEKEGSGRFSEKSGHQTPPEPEKLQRAKKNACSLLRARPRSESELRQRLKMKGHGVEIVESVVNDLRRAGQIDDAKFARLWVESRMHSNPAGDVVLRHELKEKGIDEAVIEATLAGKAQLYDEFKVAFGMAEERFGRLKKIDKRKALKRLYDFLYRRGFAYDVVQRVIAGIIGRAPDEAD
jgi:regulatory protein